MDNLTPEQRAFESYWKKKASDVPSRQHRIFLKKDDIWGEPGYAQPAVHFDWLAFRAGVEWERNRK